MKSLLVASLFSIIMILGVSQAYAEVTIETAIGSGAPGCEETSDGCYSPVSANITVGEKITWNNVDTAAHTVTSGDPDDGPDGNFDSSLFMSGNSFSHIFDEAGTYDYFCMVHPWMTGVILVTGNIIPEQEIPTPPIQDNTLEIENQQLQNEISNLKSEIRDLKALNSEQQIEIQSLKDQIVSMTKEFVDSLTQLNEWFRSQLS